LNRAAAVADPDLLRGEDLRARTVRGLSLVSLLATELQGIVGGFKIAAGDKRRGA